MATRHRPYGYAGLFLAAAFVVLQCLDVMTYPLFSYDEALLNDAGWQLITTGRFRADILSLNRGFEDHYLWQPPGLPLASAVSYQLFGFGIWQTRLASILFGGLGVWAVFAFVRSINPGTTGAWVAALALFFWPDWVLTAKESRMDTAAIMALVVATHLVVQSLRPAANPALRTFFLAGLCASVATVFHTAALPWGASLAVIILAFARDRLRSTLVFGVGAAVLAGAWLTYAQQFLPEFQAQYLSLLLNRSGGGGILDRFAAEGARYALEFRRLPAIYLLALAALVGMIAGRRWRDRQVRALLALTALLLLLHALVAGKISGFYTLYPMTLVFCLIGTGIEACLAESGAFWRRRWIALGATVACLAFMANIAAFSVGPRLLAYWFQGPQRDYAVQMAPLSSRLKPGDQVWGSAVAWIAVVKAGARLDALDWVPGLEGTRPDPQRHKYVVVDRDASFAGADGYRKIDGFGAELPLVFGSRLSNKPYDFDLWQSNALQ
ncbi:glycosyltransferase family 39 protein [Reyranella sp.]|uniref:ArnT family glycosyltransferase n=1 Tax=Reyranella sp. TaxID=1929291 RepID=UPI0025DE12F5|nr:glycosyltransferase family 39 protein [Reyranella sp.]